MQAELRATTERRIFLRSISDKPRRSRPFSQECESCSKRPGSLVSLNRKRLACRCHPARRSHHPRPHFERSLGLSVWNGQIVEPLHFISAAGNEPRAAFTDIGERSKAIVLARKPTRPSQNRIVPRTGIIGHFGGHRNRKVF